MIDIEKQKRLPVDENTFRHVLNFSDADLKENRAGRMSERQMRRYGFYNLLRVALLVTGCGAAVLIIVIGCLSSLERPSFSDVLMALLCAGLFGPGGLLLPGGVIRRYRQMRAELSAAAVKKYRGKGYRRCFGKVRPYKLQIAGKTISVDYAVYKAIEDGTEYTVYVTPISRTIVSIERVS